MEVMQAWPILAFMAVQTVGITWWAATMTSRVGQLERDAGTHNGHGEKLARIETHMEGIEDKLEAVIKELQSKRSR